jgi:hypothetical protein
VYHKHQGGAPSRTHARETHETRVRTLDIHFWYEPRSNHMAPVAKPKSSSATTTETPKPQKLSDNKRAGLRLPVTRTGNKVRLLLPNGSRVGARARVALAAQIECVFRDLFAEAAEQAHAHGKKSVSNSHLETAMFNNVELKRVFDSDKFVLVGATRVRPIRDELKLVVKRSHASAGGHKQPNEIHAAVDDAADDSA